MTPEQAYAHIKAVRREARACGFDIKGNELLVVRHPGGWATLARYVGK